MEHADITDADLDFPIDASEEWQCRWWSHEFRCTPEQVRAAALAVGGSANAIRAHLERAELEPQPQMKRFGPRESFQPQA